MRGDEAELAGLLEAEARVVRGNALDHDGGLACFFGAAERVPDQPCPHTDALAIRPNRHRREIEDPCTGSTFNADPAQHQVSNHTGGVLSDQRQLRNELFRRPNALDERRDLVRVSDECRAHHLGDHGIVRVALGTDDDALGHGGDRNWGTPFAPPRLRARLGPPALTRRGHPPPRRVDHGAAWSRARTTPTSAFSRAHARAPEMGLEGTPRLWRINVGPLSGPRGRGPPPLRRHARQPIVSAAPDAGLSPIMIRSVYPPDEPGASSSRFGSTWDLCRRQPTGMRERAGVLLERTPSMAELDGDSIRSSSVG